MICQEKHIAGLWKMSQEENISFRWCIQGSSSTWQCWGITGGQPPGACVPSQQEMSGHQLDQMWERLDTRLDPRSTQWRGSPLASWRVYPPADTWTVPLLTSLMELKSDSWEVNFDLEEEECLEDDAISFMIEASCTGWWLLMPMQYLQLTIRVSCKEKWLHIPMKT